MLERIHGVEIELLGDGASMGDGERDLAVLRIAHEAVNNSLRHAGAAHITVRFEGDDGGVRLEVADDGSGFDPDVAEVRARHLGLTSMEERAEELGGRLRIHSSPGTGTTVTLEVPR